MKTTQPLSTMCNQTETMSSQCSKVTQQLSFHTLVKDSKRLCSGQPFQRQLAAICYWKCVIADDGKTRSMLGMRDCLFMCFSKASIAVEMFTVVNVVEGHVNQEVG